MLKRCYSIKYHEDYPTYIECEVCDDWKYYSNFKKWYNENYYECNEERMHLDKDIICKGNKIYSPETCVFVPQRISSIFENKIYKKGEYPIGVSYSKTAKRFKAQCNVYNVGDKKYKNIGLGYYNTPEEAFYKYKEFKEDYIKKVAEEYKDIIPVNLYEAMNKYVVDIND